MNPSTFEVLPRDLRPYRAGNTGIDYVHRFESGKPGPHVLINGITHGVGREGVYLTRPMR
jgi:hypothetical protein